MYREDGPKFTSLHKKDNSVSTISMVNRRKQTWNKGQEAEAWSQGGVDKSVISFWNCRKGQRWSQQWQAGQNHSIRMWWASRSNIIQSFLAWVKGRGEEVGVINQILKGNLRGEAGLERKKSPRRCDYSRLKAPQSLQLCDPRVPFQRYLKAKYKEVIQVKEAGSEQPPHTQRTAFSRVETAFL